MQGEHRTLDQFERGEGHQKRATYATAAIEEVGNLTNFIHENHSRTMEGFQGAEKDRANEQKTNENSVCRDSQSVAYPPRVSHNTVEERQLSGGDMDYQRHEGEPDQHRTIKNQTDDSVQVCGVIDQCTWTLSLHHCQQHFETLTIKEWDQDECHREVLKQNEGRRQNEAGIQKRIRIRSEKLRQQSKTWEQEKARLERMIQLKDEHLNEQMNKWQRETTRLTAMVRGRQRFLLEKNLLRQGEPRLTYLAGELEKHKKISREKEMALKRTIHSWKKKVGEAINRLFKMRVGKCASTSGSYWPVAVERLLCMGEDSLVFD